MKEDNIRSPRQDGKAAEHWTPEALEGAQPYPLPEVPPEGAKPAKPPRAPGKKGRGQAVEGGRPENT